MLWYDTIAHYLITNFSKKHSYKVAYEELKQALEILTKTLGTYKNVLFMLFQGRITWKSLTATLTLEMSA